MLEIIIKKEKPEKNNSWSFFTWWIDWINIYSTDSHYLGPFPSLSKRSPRPNLLPISTWNPSWSDALAFLSISRPSGSLITFNFDWGIFGLVGWRFEAANAAFSRTVRWLKLSFRGGIVDSFLGGGFTGALVVTWPLSLWIRPHLV